MVLVGAAVYATFPWWAPRDLIRDLLAQDLQRKLGTKVSIESLDLSWADGIHIRGLQIAQPPQFGEGTMVRVATIRTPCSPIDMVLRDQVAYMEIDSPQADVRFDQAGNCNLSVLSVLDSPKAQRVSMHGARATVLLPPNGDGACPKPLDLAIADMQIMSGKLGSLGAVTVSGSIVQGQCKAPLTVRFDNSGPRPADPASALVAFSAVDLSQVDLAGLGLPLRGASGTCNGTVNIKINRQTLRVDHFSVDVTANKLDIQPPEGPDLPQIDTARLKFQGTYVPPLDPLASSGGKIELQQALIHLPGVQLEGSATLFGDISGGDFDSLKHLQLTGAIEPDRLAALLGRPLGEDGWKVRGPVAVTVSVKHDGQRLGLQVQADLGRAEVACGQRIIKDDRTELSLTAGGVLDHHTWHLKLDQGRLRLGDNSFDILGDIPSVDRIAAALASGEASTTELASLASRFTVRGVVDIGDLRTLRNVTTQLGLPWPQVSLTGRLGGQWHVANGMGGMTLELPAESVLHMPDVVDKPAGQPMSLRLSCPVGDGQALAGGQAELRLGESSISLHDIAARSDAGAVEIGAAFEAERIEGIVACIDNRLLGGLQLGGGMLGKASARLADDRQELRVQADLTGAKLIHRDLLTKLPHQGLGVELEASRVPGDQIDDISAQVDLSSEAATVHLRAAGKWSASDASRRSIEVEVAGQIHESALLAVMSPPLADLLHPHQVCGPIAFSGTADLTSSGLKGEFHVRADDARYEHVLAAPADRTATQQRRVKAAGVPLRLDVKVSGGPLASLQSADARLELERCRVQLGRNILDIKAAAKVDSKIQSLLPIPGAAALGLVQPSVDVDGSWSAQVHADASLDELLPELSELVRRNGLSGKVSLEGTFTNDRDGVRLCGQIDATQLGAASILLALADDQATTQPAQRIVGPFVKPAGLCATGQFTVTLPPSLKWARLSSCMVQVGDVHVLADASADLDWAAGPDWQLPLVRPQSAHLVFSAGDLSNVDKLCPFLQPYSLRGGAFVDVELKAAPGGVHVASADLKATDMGLCYNGRDVRASGMLMLENVLGDEKGISIGRIKTDDMRLWVDQSPAMLICDVQDFPAATKGSFHAVVERIDDRELADWLELDSGADSAQAPAAAPSDGRPIRLTGAQIEQTRDKARTMIGWARRYVTPMDLSGRIEVAHLRTFDARLAQVFEARDLVLDVRAASGGHIELKYIAGVNGGNYSDSLEVHLNDAMPTVTRQTSARELLAGDSVQAMLTHTFPGNTVFGTFSHRESHRMSLEDLLASAIEPKFNPRKVGSALTQTTDGLLEGRAAPRPVARIFPGLNLAKYRYNTMTAFGEFLDDGTSQNDMIFDGHAYNMYIDGTTDADNIGRYDVGLILAGSPQTPQWNHRYKLGRLLLLTFQARIENGKKYDEEVSYPWPNEALGALLIRNNFVYRMWKAQRN